MRAATESIAKEECLFLEGRGQTAFQSTVAMSKIKTDAFASGHMSSVESGDHAVFLHDLLSDNTLEPLCQDQ